MPTNFANPTEDVLRDVVTRIYNTSTEYLYKHMAFSAFLQQWDLLLHANRLKKKTVETKRMVYPCTIIAKCMCLSIDMDSEILLTCHNSIFSFLKKHFFLFAISYRNKNVDLSLKAKCDICIVSPQTYSDTSCSCQLLAPIQLMLKVKNMSSIPFAQALFEEAIL